MEIWMAISGLLVGIIIGATGMGGGMIMTPLLIFGFGIPPATAIGTDLIFAAVTKSFGSWQHWRQKTIDFALLRRVARGSIPGTLAGLSFLYMIKQENEALLNVFMTKSLAVVFIVISIVMLLQPVIKKKVDVSGSWSESDIKVGTLIVIGFLVGFLVAVTSVGSGTLFIALLLWFYPSKASALVGTDLLHGVLITLLAGWVHSYLGTIDLPLAAHLLAGSIPGVLIGSRLTIRLPKHYVRISLIVMMMVTSIILLYR